MKRRDGELGTEGSSPANESHACSEPSNKRLPATPLHIFGLPSPLRIRGVLSSKTGEAIFSFAKYRLIGTIFKLKLVVPFEILFDRQLVSRPGKQLSRNRPSAVVVEGFNVACKRFQVFSDSGEKENREPSWRAG